MFAITLATIFLYLPSSYFGEKLVRGAELGAEFDEARKLCLEGRFAQCRNLGRRLNHLNRSKDAASFLKIACRGGDRVGCQLLASILMQNNEVDAAVLSFEKACLLGDELSCASFEDLALKKFDRDSLVLDHCRDKNPRLCFERAQTLAKSEPLVAKALFKHACTEQYGLACQKVAAAQGEDKLRLHYSTLACKYGQAKSCRIAAQVANDLGDYDLALVYGHQSCLKGIVGFCNGEPSSEVATTSKPSNMGNSLTARCMAGDLKTCEGAFRLSLSNGDWQRAIKPLSKLCGAGSVAFCYELGLAEERVGNLDQSQRTFSKSCDRGHPDSCREAGNISFRKNAKKIALSFWEKACVLKDGGACLKLSEGNGLELNPEKAAKYLRLSCLAGISHACQKLATVAKGKADRELVTAGKQKACAMGHAVECMALAQIHRVNGKRSLAKNYLEKACRYGETGSCIDQIIERRKVVRKDPSRRKKWLQYLCGSKDGGKCLSAANLLRERGLDWLALEAFQMACQLGEPNGCRILAKESRLKGNDKKFLSFSKKACSLGDGDACTEARRILKASPKTKSGRKSGPNEMDALLKTSCDNDSGKACYELGKIREEQGQKNKAKPLYQKACKLGFGWDCQNSEMAH